MAVSRHFHRCLLLAVALIVCSYTIHAERQSKRELAQIPEVAADGSIPEDLKTNNFIFLDVKAGDLILAYPPDLTYENFDNAHDKVRSTERVPLAISVQPSFDTSVAIGTDGVLHYEFKVGNGSSAAQSLWKWVLSIPVVGAEIKPVRGPRGWGFNTWEREEQQIDSTLAVMNLNGGTPPKTAANLVTKQMKWWIRTEDAAIKPGECCASFFADSTLLPGLRLAYFQGPHYKVWASASVPDVLSDRLPAFNFIETNSVSLPVVAPSYDPMQLPEARVCAILKDLETLVADGRISRTPYVSDLLDLSPGCLTKTVADLGAAVQTANGRATDSLDREIRRTLEINLAAK